MAKLFISYRREDSQDIAGRLYDRCAAKYGRDNIAFDVDSIPFGVDFRAYLADQVRGCDVLLALIGKNWVDCKNEQGTRRLEDKRDFVRIEIESAIRQGVPVIPVLVGGAMMPGEAKLPRSLSDFAYINAPEVSSGRDFDAHANRLFKAIDRLVSQKAGDSSREMPARDVADGIAAPPKGTGSSPGHRLLQELKRLLESNVKDTHWELSKSQSTKGWWLLCARRGPIVRARPSTNQLRVRIRKNTERPKTNNIPLVSDNWIAESKSSVVKNDEDLSLIVKQIEAEWA